jgi:glycosyltransferase involved in cell wall biosynthesis
METILIATDAWEPQVNGVVTTLKYLQTNIKSHNVVFITPNDFNTIYNPFYSEIRFALPSKQKIKQLIENANPTYIHISTEGPIGYYVRQYCLKNNKKFTTSYHTKFPELLQKQLNIPAWLTRWYFKKFHNSGSGVFCATPSLKRELSMKGFKNIINWTRGVDTELFKPADTIKKLDPVFLYVGRVSREKNLEAFLTLDLPGYKIVVGDGPELNNYRNTYWDVEFVGIKKDQELVECYQQADVFCFPSKTDTFGLVVLEALSCGVPVAAFPVTGPKDILTDKTGVMSDDLYQACIGCLKLQSKDCVDLAKTYDWNVVAKQFVNSIVKI